MNTSIGHNDRPGSFSPQTVDDEIARYLSTAPQPTETTGDAHLIHEIAAYHALPPEADVSLARVHARVRHSIDAPGDGNASMQTDSVVHTHVERDSDPHSPQRVRADNIPSSRMRRLELLPAPLRAIAAVLVVALLIGGFVAVFHLPGARQNATPTWQNVAISHANARGKSLDFDPAHVQVDYAVSDVDGTIYALGGNHLWYSKDGGATYQPFTPSLPPIKSGVSYKISVVSGLRGIFATTGLDSYLISGFSSGILYAEAGAARWRTLTVPNPNAVLPVTQTGTSITFSADDIWNAIFPEYAFDWSMPLRDKPVMARAMSNWIFVLAPPIFDKSLSMLIGTPDFGATWYALSATLPATLPYSCTRFAVNPADVRQLFCLMGSNTVEQTMDGGLTWQQVSNASDHTNNLYAWIWASQRAVYMYSSTWGASKQTLAQHPIGAGDWFAVATLPSDSQVIDVSSDGTVYAARVGSPGKESQETLLSVSVLAPGARQFSPVGAEAKYSIPSSYIYLSLGGLYSGKARAVYAHIAPTAPVGNPRPLYRLVLPAADNSPQPVVTPFLTPTSPSIATPISHGPCTSARGDVANIQNGGYGADLDTFAQRWGPSDGVAGGSEYFGRWPDGTPKMQVADAIPSNQRVYMMDYTVDKAQDMTLAQAVVFAGSILPKDTALLARTQQGNEVIAFYCSAALIAAFPTSVQDINGPLPHNGWVIVSYGLRNDGNISDIRFGPQA